VFVESSSLGGASFRFCWPVKPTFSLKADLA
jgi:two-component system sensor histidine kinase RstB